jgi:AmpE protein
MVFLTVTIVLGLIQLWGSGAPLHHDLWFLRWVTWLRENLFKVTEPVQQVQGETLLSDAGERGPLASIPEAALPLAVGGPLLVLILFLQIVVAAHSWLYLFVSVPVLLYCLGRGEFAPVVQEYLMGWSSRDWTAAVAAVSKLGADKDTLNTITESGQCWSDLHRVALSHAGYCGFERMFAVLFWFVLLGPVGALLYRLSALYSEHAVQQNDAAVAKRWLWILEWPAVRVLGISFALTGNFVGCFQQWRAFLTCVESSSEIVLMHAIRGALTISDRLSMEVSDNELRALQSLLSRTLLLWVCLLAIFSLIV